MKKGILRVVCAVSLLAVTSASAEWKFAGYDTTNPNQYGKIYNEVLRGKFTSKQKVDPVDPKDVEWKFESYELDYPHAGYERLYLEGNPQAAITRTAPVFPQWETRFRDFMWEITSPYRIYQRQETKIFNKTWRWDFGKNEYDESLVFVPTTRFAPVTIDYRTYGFANLDNEGKYVFDVNGKVYNHEKNELYVDFEIKDQIRPFNVELDAKGNPTSQIVAGDFFHSDNLSRLDSTNQFAVSDWEIAAHIDHIESKFVTGPTYAGEPATKDVAGVYYQYAAAGWRGWDWDPDTILMNRTKNGLIYGDDGKAYTPIEAALLGIEPKPVKIAWGTPEFENDYPYRYFQYLIVNDVILDGHNDTPRVFRYTGGVATPDVAWNFAFAEAAYPYQVVEYKYLKNNEGKWMLAVDGNGLPIWRYAPVSEMGRTYLKVTDTHVECWVKDDDGDRMVAKKSRVDADFGDWYAGFVGAAGYVALP